MLSFFGERQSIDIETGAHKAVTMLKYFHAMMPPWKTQPKTRIASR